ncbi:lectin ADEL [Aplysia californica]|uniref:Lectin ADEL n=1 Tax=Aplysia californica TaxID=6500 RepID=A0ABM0K7M3_APLCA|nr:lectin ADEL [Aplysia californica]
MKMLCVAACLVLLVAAAHGCVNAPPRCALVKMESWGWKFFSKPLLPAAWITSVSVEKDFSGGYCKPASGYGFSTNELWVAHGCRGLLKVCAVANKCVTKTLNSNNYAFASEQIENACYVSSMEIKTRQGPPCVADVNYGFTGPYVWVNGGCRAEFTVCYVQ